MVVDVATDASGNVYVVGHTFDGDYDIITTKYNVNGVQQWQKTYSSADDYAIGVGVDGSGNVYVVGQVNTGSNNTTGAVTIKYNSSGTQQWATSYTTGSVSHSVTVRDAAFDGSGNTFITGRISSTIFGNDIVVLKANPSTGAYTAANYNIDLAQEGFKIDVSGSDLFVIGYEAANKKLIALRYPTGFSAGVSPTATSTYTSGSNLEVRAMAVRNSDNVLVLSSAGSNLLLNKFDLNSTVSGEFGVTRAMDNPTDLTFDGSGNIYITGSTFVTSSNRLRLIKYNSAGTFQVESTLQPATGNSNHSVFSSEGRSIFLDSNNDIIIGGVLVWDDPTNGNNNLSEYVGVVKFSTAGAQQAVYPYSTTLESWSVKKAIPALSNSVVIVGGGTVAIKTWFMCNPPTVNLGSDITQAYNPSSPNITLDAGGGHTSHLWNTGATTRTIAVSTTGTYSVTVGNSIGCEAFDEIAVNITPINQTITFNPPVTPFEKTLVTDAASFGISATSNSGLHPTFSSLNTSVATVSNNGNGTATVNIVGAGEAVIRASQGGNQYYNSAANVDRTLTVHKAVQSVDFPPVSDKLITINNFEIVRSTITGASGAEATQLVSSNTSLATVDNYSNWQVNMIAAGQVTLTATVPGNETYLEGQAQRMFNINKASQQITFSLGENDTQTMGNPDFFLFGTSNEGLPVTYTSTNTNVATLYQFETSWKVHLEGAGTTTITAQQPGNDYYLAATPVGDQLTVGKGTQGIDFPLQSTAVIGDQITLSASTNAGLTVTFESSDEEVGSIAGDVLTLLAGGSVTITASQPGNNDWEAATPVEKQLAVSDPVAPSFVNGGPVVSGSDGVSVTIEVSLDKQGIVYAVALADDSPAPTAAEVKNGTGAGGSTPINATTAFVNTPSSPESFDVSSLSNGTQYDVYLVAQNVDNILQSSPTKLDVTAQDVDDPVFDDGYPSLSNISAGGFELTVSLNETSTVYYVVGLHNASTPSPAQVKSGSLADGQPALLDGQIVATDASQEFSGQLASLSENTAYRLLYVAEDYYGNLQDAVGSLSVTTLDITPPSFTGGTPKVVDLTETTAEIAVKLNESGTVFYILVPNNAAAPSVAEIKAGQSAGGGSPLSSGLVENVDEDGSFIQLSFSGTNELDLYLVATDQAASPNNQSEVTKLDLEDFDPSPSFTSGYPALDQIDANYFRLIASLNQSGKVYFVVLHNNATAPSALEVKSGQANGGAAPLRAGELEITLADTEYSTYVAGFSPETDYDVYLVAENLNEDIQASPTKTDVQTIFKADTYYWVGNGGSWSDLNHWATTSGGLVKHLTLPDKFDNVVFDGNSFTATSQQVAIDLSVASCAGLDLLAITNDPTLYSDFGQELHVHGSISWGTGLTFSLNNLHIKGTGEHTISGGSDWDGILDVYFEGSGSYAISDDFTVRSLFVDAGELTLENEFTNAVTFIVRGSVEPNPVVNLGSSEIIVSDKFGVWSGGNFAANTSGIHLNGAILEAGGAAFNELTVSGVSSITGSAEAASIVIEPATKLTLPSGETITIDALEAQGSNSQFIELNSSVPGQQATISKSAGEVNIAFARIQDIEATGGATFTATSSIDLGNNSGWQIEAPADASYYWVGGTGSWSDIGHWATSSGGDVFHSELPGLLNNVYFDEQSFSNSGERVTLDIDASVKSMDWDGALAGSEFHAVGHDLEIYGDLILSGTSTYETGSLIFQSADAGNSIAGAGRDLGESSKLQFEGTGEWNINGDLSVNALEVASGSLSFLGDEYTITNRIDINGSAATELNLGTATLSTGQYFDVSNPSNVTLLAQNATLHISGANFYGGGKSFGEVIFYEDVYVRGSNSFGKLEIMEGVKLKVLAGSTQTIEDLVAIGSLSSPVYINSDIEGEVFNFSKSTGEVNISYTILQDNEATGGAVFNAIESYSEGNVSGWNISEPARAEQMINFEAPTGRTFGDSPFFLEASATSGLSVTFQLISGPASVSFLGQVIINGAGEVTVKAVQVGNLQYQSAFEELSFTVLRKAQAINFDPISDKAIEDSPFALTASGGGSGNPIVFAVVAGPATIVSNELTITGPGTITVRATQAGNANYEAATPVEQTFDVTAEEDEEVKASQTISFGALTAKSFGDAAFALSATASSGLSVSYVSSNTEVATISGNTVTILSAGQASITASQAGSDNYLAAESVVQVLVVNKATQTISFELAETALLSTGSLNISATSSSGLEVTLRVTSGPATLEGNVLSFSGAGEVTLTASQQGNGNYLSADNIVRKIVVSSSSDKASQTITFGALDPQTYGTPAFGLSATASSGLAVSYSSSNQQVATISGNTVTILGAGETSITASQAGDDNHLAAGSVSQLLIVNKASQTISFANPGDKTFGDAPITLSATTTAGLQVGFSVTGPASLEGNILTLTGTGAVTITALQAGNENYLPAQNVTQTFEVISDQQVINGVAPLIMSTKVFPNPVTHWAILEISGSSIGEISVRVSDLAGVLVSEKTFNKFAQKITIDLETSTWGKGIYLLIVSSAHDSAVLKISKE